MQNADSRQHASFQPVLNEAPSFYEILGLDSSCSLTKAQIRAAYKRALLQHHPDKQAPEHKLDEISVDAISLAYQVLSNPVAKQEYDAAPAIVRGGQASDKFTAFRTGLETVDLDDLLFNETQRTWTRPCRCGIGGGYTITEDDLERYIDDRELITGCKGCSLWIRVLFSIA